MPDQTVKETRNGADLPAVSVSVPTSVCRPTASGPVLYVTRVPLITGATVPTPSSVTADGVTASLVTSSTEAAEMLQENVTSYAKLVTLAADDYAALIPKLSQRGVIGGAVYDAVIARAAEIAQVDCLVTLNEAHFRQLHLSVRLQTVGGRRFNCKTDL